MIEYSNGKTDNCDSNLLRKLPIQRAEMLKKKSWLVVYSERNYGLADSLTSQFQKSAPTLQMRVEEPEWIQLKREDDTDSFARELKGYIQQYGEP